MEGMELAKRGVEEGCGFGFGGMGGIAIFEDGDFKEQGVGWMDLEAVSTLVRA